MTPKARRQWLDVTVSRYLDALEREDFDAQSELWALAETDAELEAAFHELHVGLMEEEQLATAASIEDAVERHLPSAEVVRAASGPVTVADVADELFRHAPDRLSAEAHALNDRLRSARDPLPEELGLSKLVAWAEAQFGTAPAEYWRAFRTAALKLEMRRAAEIEFQLAARRAPRPEDRK